MHKYLKHILIQEVFINKHIKYPLNKWAYHIWLLRNLIQIVILNMTITLIVEICIVLLHAHTRVSIFVFTEQLIFYTPSSR